MTAVRRMAAIMFTDMVGYSAMTQKDEALSMILLREHRGLMRPLFEAHSGKEIKTTGDGFLVEFSNALDATQCAISMQESLVNHNKVAEEARRLEIRIGIHLGEIEEYENDVYGDGVNIAARIEPLAESNGICVTEEVARQVEKKISYPLVSMGEPVLKNITATIEVFRVVAPWLADSIHFVPQKFKQELTAFKSIAVLPFVNMSSDEENEYFSDGLTEELINVLARLQNLKITSRTSVFMFKGKNVPLQQIGKQLNVDTVLEGSVRKAGNKVRITGQLIRVADDTHLWSGTFDRELNDIFAVQDEIAQSIVDTLEVHLSANVEVVRVKRPTDNMEAYTLYLQGRFHMNKQTPDDIYNSIECYEQALAEDAGYALAYVGSGLAYLRLTELGLVHCKEGYEKVWGAAQQAIELDNTLAEAHTLMGLAIRNKDWDYEAAEKEFKIALALNPIDVMVHNSYGALLLFNRRYDEAIAMHSIANEMDPLHLPTLIWFARAHIYAGHYDEGIAICEKIFGMASDFPFAHMFLTLAYLWKGDYHATLSMLKRTRHLTAEYPIIYSIVSIAQHHMGNSDNLKKCLAQLLAQQQEQTSSQPITIACIYAELGNEDQTMAWLQKAYKEQHALLCDLKAWPRDNAIYQYPEVAAFLDNVGYPDKINIK